MKRCGLLLLALFTPSVAADEPADYVAAAVRELASPDFAVREHASISLWLAGKAAEPVLEGAAAGDDPEVRARAGEILDRFRRGFRPEAFGLGPASPPEIVEKVLRYDASDEPGRIAAAKELFSKGDAGYPPLAGLAAVEPEGRLRDWLAVKLASVMSRRLLADWTAGREEAVESLLRAGALADGDAARVLLAACLLLRGGLDAEIAGLTARPADGAASLPADRLLALLRRARGDPGEASPPAGNTAAAEADARLRDDWRRTAATVHRCAGAVAAKDPVRAAAFLARLADAHERLGERDAALAALRKAADLDPADAGLRARIGRLSAPPGR